MSGNMSSQRPFFLSTFFAAFRQSPSSLSNASSSTQQPNKHASQPSASAQQTSAATPRSISSSAAAAASQATSPPSRSGGVMSQLPLHSPRHHHHHHHHHSAGIPIPQPQGRDNNRDRRRGSDSSSEGFRDALGAEKLYIGGRTAAGEERFFKLGVVRRVRSGDRLSLDRLSL